ncbi:MAG: WD40 repeat domain-containing protein [Pseudomonadota bacterium]
MAPKPENKNVDDYKNIQNYIYKKYICRKISEIYTKNQSCFSVDGIEVSDKRLILLVEFSTYESAQATESKSARRALYLKNIAIQRGGKKYIPAVLIWLRRYGDKKVHEELRESLGEYADAFFDIEPPLIPTLKEFDDHIRDEIARRKFDRQNSQVATQIEQRILELQTTFFGRESDYQTIDEFIDNNANGLITISAPAGTGKSAFLANWLKKEQYSDDNIVYHFISNSISETTNAKTVYENLREQLQCLSMMDYGSAEEKRNLPNHKFLYDFLCHKPADQRRLFIVIDALDEAIELFEPFMEPSTMGKNVFVILSARRDTQFETVYLQEWYDRCRKGLPLLELPFTGLKKDDVCLWLEEQVPEISDIEVNHLSKELYDATDGFPLFLAYLIEDLHKKLPLLSSAEERLGALQEIPDDFALYIHDQIALIREMNRETWSAQIKPFLSVLSRVFGPISRFDIQGALGDQCPDLENLPTNVTRWLRIANGRYSFAHPRLAEVFASVIGRDKDEIVLASQDVSPSVLRQETAIVEWLKSAWQAENRSDGTLTDNAEYAHEWLPEHLARMGQEGEYEAARLIANPQYLLSRLRGEPSRAADRLAKHCNLWAKLPLRQKNESWAREWTAFWAENESKLRSVAERIVGTSLSIVDIVSNCLGDAAVSGTGNAPDPRAWKPMPIPQTNLLRSVDDAHAAEVLGVLAIEGGGLVSWGNDGALRFWGAQGTRIEGGDDKAHNGSINGVLPIEDGGFLSWGSDGALRFWDDQGGRKEGGDDKAHDRSIMGVLAIEDGGFVSWGNDGALRFWDDQGGRKKGGDDEAHDRSIDGVLPIRDGGFVSWGEDCALRFWDARGERMQGKDDNANREAIKGVLPLDGGGFVTWDWSCSLRFWNAHGERVQGGDDNAHNLSIEGALSLDSGGFVSWDRDGALRFWDAHGERMQGGGDNAHIEVINGVLPLDGGGCVSWGVDGALRFWDANGARMQGGDDKAHSQSINGVLAVDGNVFVSWGDDGALRFWNAHGARIQHTDDNAHRRLINGVLPLEGGGFVSWGDEGALRFWDADGARMQGGDDNAHKCSIDGVLPLDGGGFVSWGDYGALRFWDADGARMQGGDEYAHRWWIKGVLPLDGGGCVSWGVDCALRFWDAHGARIQGGDDNAHRSSIKGVLPLDGGGCVSWGADGALRFWDNQAQLRDTLVSPIKCSKVVLVSNRTIALLGTKLIFYSIK